jgi:glycosyltransferase involved in cell wall biosynthesis
LIEALALVRARGYDVRLQIIGDGDQRRALEQQARDLNLESRVEFLGLLPQADLPRFYSQCAVFVLPSIQEGLGLVLAEALLCGAPVITTNLSGVTDIVKNGETGLLVPERDPRLLADALEKILCNPEFAAELAANGQAWVRKYFSSDRVRDEFLNLYHTVYTLAR